MAVDTVSAEKMPAATSIEKKQESGYLIFTIIAGVFLYRMMYTEGMRYSSEND